MSQIPIGCTLNLKREVFLERLFSCYGVEEKYREVLFSWRYPSGFACCGCGINSYCEIEARKVVQRNPKQAFRPWSWYVS